MPYTTPVASYSATSTGTYTALTGIQSILINRGRQKFQDPIPQSSCIIELIPATSYALPLAVGQCIDVRNANSASSPCYFAGLITDIQRTYDMPYDSSTGYAPGDRITITATGGTGSLGSAVLTNDTWVSKKVYDVIDELCNENGVLFGGGLSNTSVASAQTYSGSLLDAINDLCRTGQYFIDDMDNKRSRPEKTGAELAFGTYTGSIIFSDTGFDTYRYTNLEYLSSVQNTFNQVTVQAAGLANQTTSSGTTPYNTLVYSTFNNSTADALSLSSYLYELLSGRLTAVPYLMRTTTLQSESMLTWARIPTIDTNTNMMQSIIQINFRGTTAFAQVQGISTAFYEDYASIQFYLSPSLGTAFTLDSASNGVLDTNRLGYP
jgi:hypothetical protein